MRPFLLRGLCLVLLIMCPAVSVLAEENSKPTQADHSGGETHTTPAGQTIEDLIDGFEDDTAAQGAGDCLDEVLEGFDDETVMPEEQDRSPEEQIGLSIDGHMLLGVTVNIAHNAPEQGQTDWRGLSRLTPKLFIEADYALSHRWKAVVGANFFYDLAYVLNGRSQYTDEVLDEYEAEAEIRDLYMAGGLTDDLDVKIGRQIVVWGKSDNIRVTDVINPLDMRRPGMTDIEDLRLPVAMTRVDYYKGAWNLTGLALHEHRFNKNPVYGGDFYPGDAPLPDEERPDSGLENTEWALALNGIFSGKDISFYWADIYNDQAHVARDDDRPTAAVHLVHARLMMVGIAYNHALGNWLLKTEAAWLDGLRYSATGNERFSRTDVLIGAEYTGFTETTISLELVNRHINDFDHRLKAAPDYAQEDDFQSVVRFSKDFANNTVHLTVLASTFGPLGRDGAFQRLTLAYDLLDALTLTGGLVLYESGDQYIMEGIGDNDRVFAELKYSF